MTSARLQRWVLTLSPYTYTIKYKSGKQQDNADALNRFPLEDVPTTVLTPAETIAVLEHLSTIPLTTAKIKLQIERDTVLSKLKRNTQSGWPESLDADDANLKPFHNRRNELSLEDNVLL